MKPPSPPLLPLLVARVLLRLYPAAFRRELGDDVLALVEDLAREERCRRSALGTLRLAVAVAADLVPSALRMRWERLHRSAPPPLPVAEPHPPARGPVAGSGRFPLDRGDTLMESWMFDLRSAFRSLARRPGFSAAAVLLLALGLGTAATILGLADAALFKPLPYPRPGELVTVWESKLSEGRETNVVNPGNYLAWRESAKSFTGMAAVYPSSAELTGLGEAQEVECQLVVGPFFRLLEVEPALGRTFDLSPEVRDGQDEDVVVVSHGFWQRALGSDPDAVGRSLTIQGKPRVVVGVMPRGFQFQDGSVFGPVHADFWLPFVFEDGAREWRGRFLTVFARLAPGVSPDEALAEMDTLAEGLATARPDFNDGWGANVVPLHEQLVGKVEKALFTLLAAVGFLLLIASANVANLLLARAIRERHQLGLRAALGATRWRLLRHAFVQSAVLAVAGAILGLALADFGTRLLVAVAPDDIPLLAGAAIEGRIVVAVLAFALLQGLAFSFLPLLVAPAARRPGAVLRGSRVAAGGGGLRRLLLIAEVATAVMLLVGAGLSVRSFHRLVNEDPGLRPENLLTLRLNLPSYRYEEASDRTDFLEGLVDELEARPDVTAAGLITSLPVAGMPSATSLWHAGEQRPEPGRLLTTDVRQVDRGYFRAMGIELVAGRDVSRDDGADAPPVVVVNLFLADALWPGEEAVGKRLIYSWGDEVEAEVVGVVGDVTLTGPGGEVRSTLYRPLRQAPSGSAYLARRTAGSPLGLAADVRAAVASRDPELPVADLQTMETVLSESVAEPRLRTWLFGLFGGVATFLAALGVYAVVAYTVSERRREFGVRLALGAARGDVLRSVLGRGMTTVGAGLALGVGAALLGARWIESLLFGITATDPATYVWVSLLLALVALGAMIIPAHQATRVDPTEAIRQE